MNREEDLPKDLVHAAKAFAERRKLGGKHTRYPQELIEQVKILLLKHRLSKVSAALGVCPGTLRRWVPSVKKKIVKNPSRVKAIPIITDFIELAAMPVVAEGIEVRLHNGVTIRFPSSISPNFLAETCKHF